MAITRIWQSGAETGSLQEWDNTSGANFTVSSLSSYTGTYSFRQFGGGGVHYGVLNTFTGTRQLRMGYWVNGWQTPTVAAGRVMNSFMTSGLSNLVRAYVRGDLDTMYINVAGTDRISADIPSGYFHFGLDFKIDSSNGWVALYVNGILAGSWSGNTGNSDVGVVRLGYTESLGIGGDVSGGPFYYDDITVDDSTGETSYSAIVPKRLYWVSPNANGNYSQWTPTSGSGFQCVDERPPSDSDYVEAIAADLIDSYGLSTFTLSADEKIESVIPMVRCLRDGVTEQIAIGTRYSGTNLIGSDQTPGSSANYLLERQLTKPGGGAWDQDALDDFEILIKSRGSY